MVPLSHALTYCGILLFKIVSYKRAWGSHKARLVLAALRRIGWTQKRQSGSHRILSRPGWTDYVFCFHDDDNIGPAMMARIAKHTGLTQDDL
jgi:predicted RNA binding protein YcfA (HicA-like mRNA interferase family)